MELAELQPKLMSDLHLVAGELGIKNYRKYSKQELISKILEEQAGDRGLQMRTGLLDILPDGFGFLRTRGYNQSDSDISTFPYLRSGDSSSAVGMKSPGRSATPRTMRSTMPC